jgi:serine/threonine protein kinase
LLLLLELERSRYIYANTESKNSQSPFEHASIRFIIIIIFITIILNNIYGNIGELLDLLRRMLCIDPEKRISINEILDHEYITNNNIKKDCKSIIKI